MKKKYKGLFAMVRHVIMVGLRHRPGLFLLFFVITAATGLCMAANVFFKQKFFDSVEQLVYGSETVLSAVGLGILMAGVLVLSLALRAMSDLSRSNFFQVVTGYMGKHLNDKASRIDPIVYEDSRFLDSVNKAYAGLEAASEVTSAVLMIGVQEISYFIFMSIYFYSIKPMLLVMFALSFIPVIISSQIRRKAYARMENQAAPYRRKYEYFGKCLYSREYAKETRLWRAEGYFERLFRDNLGQAARLSWKTVRKNELREVALRFVLLIGYVGSIAMLFYYLFDNQIGIGIFAAVFSSLDQMFDRMDMVFSGYIGNISQSFGPAQNYLAFLDLKEREGVLDKPLLRARIELEEVSFSYPSSQKKALDHISLTIEKGETVAVVGANGSGKSTLTRLLMGLYLPGEGRILIDGTDIKDIAPKALYAGVSSVFQRYQCYKMSVKENTQISDSTSSQDARLALENADFPLENEKLTEGIDTMLGKDFGGIDLSGGQWQRLAIARGLYRRHDMIVLDEPTAAIDPIQEAGIYRKFAEISKDKTAVIVTHRLGSVHMADRIIVMDAGRIVDVGRHEELMAKEGVYKKMYQAQAKWYT